MKHLNFLNYLLIATAIIISSCSSDDEDEPNDINKPIIYDVEVEQGDHDHGDKIHAGENAMVHFKLSDDLNLSSWKIDIHDAFDGHSHGKVFDEFTIIRSGTVEGKNAEVEEDLGEIPADATAGEYHCIINATDAAGNSADFSEIIFVLSNGMEPVLNITSPDLENTEHMDKGMSFNMVGTLTDDAGIKSFEIFMEEEHGHDGHDHGKVGEEEVVLFDKDDFADGVTSFDLADAGQMTIPTDMEEGHYYMKFVSEDSDGNYMIEKFEIHVE